MIISELKLYNFRKFKSSDGLPGLTISFHKGLNALIGENDSGKTAVIDALKLVLLTQSNDYIHPVEEDFYTTLDGISEKEFRIELKITDFSSNEAKNFIEYLKVEKKNEKIDYSLDLFYRAWKVGSRIFSELFAGDKDEGVILENRARELLKSVYLRPLRDAEREMHSGRNSRLSQILLSHPVFQDKENHRLREIIRIANEEIEKYFTKEDGSEILNVIKNNLSEFHDQTLHGEASLATADVQLKAILESLSLNAPEKYPGLGELNLLFIAAELLLLKQEEIGGIKLALIEELEAHLHPQAQLRLITYLQKAYNESGTQIIITTHSPILASKINLKNIILLKSGQGYGLSEDKTALQKGDYLFLQRFLDSTKANLFFAKGIIMVEGDAENILIPIIADIIDYPLEKYGVSIVNVGSTAFLRYSRIFIRADEINTIQIPVSVITDCDIKPFDDNNVYRNQSEKYADNIIKKKNLYSVGSVQTFVSPVWTFEYCIARGKLRPLFHYAINIGKKIKNSDKYTLTPEKIVDADRKTKEEIKSFSSLSDDEHAGRIFNLMLDNNGKSMLKPIVSQCFAAILQWSVLEDPPSQELMFDMDLYQFKISIERKKELKEKIKTDSYLKYIVDAIEHAVGAKYNRR